MATRSFIILKLKDEHINEDLCMDNTEFPCMFDDISIFKFVKPDKPYIGIYCHFDGYPDGVGKYLNEFYNSYDDVLNLILCGSISYVPVTANDTEAFYAFRHGYEFVKPKCIDEKIMHKEKVTFYDAEYVYVFENGEWRYWESNEWGVADGFTGYIFDMSKEGTKVNSFMSEDQP